MAALSILPPGGFLFATTYALKQSPDSGLRPVPGLRHPAMIRGTPLGLGRAIAPRTAIGVTNFPKIHSVSFQPSPCQGSPDKRFDTCGSAWRRHPRLTSGRRFAARREVGCGGTWQGLSRPSQGCGQIGAVRFQTWVGWRGRGRDKSRAWLGSARPGRAPLRGLAWRCGLLLNQQRLGPARLFHRRVRAPETRGSIPGVPPGGVTSGYYPVAASRLGGRSDVAARGRGRVAPTGLGAATHRNPSADQPLLNASLRLRL